MEMETIKQHIYPSQIKDLTEKGMVKIAVNAFNNEDSDGDISMPGSFKKTLTEHFDRVRWFLNHDTTQLLGVPVKGYEEGRHLVMEAKFNLEKQIAKDTYQDYKLYAEHGKTLEHSIGVQAMQYEIDRERGIRRVKEWKLWEFSTLTSWGANQDTPLLGIKAMLEQMQANKDYSDQRKRAIENAYESLFIEPARTTREGEADFKKLVNQFDFNLLIF